MAPHGKVGEADLLHGSARVTALGLASCVGLASTMQAAINSRLGAVLGAPVFGAAACYGVGMIFVWGLTRANAARNGLPLLVFAREQPRWYELCGGVCGAVYMMVALTCVRVLGVELFFSLVVCGQLSCSTALDHIGFLGLPKAQVTRTKLAALAVALAGVFASALAEDEAEAGGGLDDGSSDHGHVSRAFYVCLTMAAGLLQPLQSTLNWRLSRLLPHKLQAVTVSFTIAGFVAATVGLFTLALGSHSASYVVNAALNDTSPWMWLGAACNVCVLTGGVSLPARISVASYYVMLLLGELSASLAFDHFGAFGMPVRHVSGPRLAGIMLVCAGAGLMQAPPGSVEDAISVVLPPHVRSCFAAIAGGSPRLAVRHTMAALSTLSPARIAARAMRGAGGGGAGYRGHPHDGKDHSSGAVLYEQLESGTSSGAAAYPHTGRLNHRAPGHDQHEGGGGSSTNGAGAAGGDPRAFVGLPLSSPSSSPSLDAVGRDPDDHSEADRWHHRGVAEHVQAAYGSAASGAPGSGQQRSDLYSGLEVPPARYGFSAESDSAGLHLSAPDSVATTPAAGSATSSFRSRNGSPRVPELGFRPSRDGLVLTGTPRTRGSADESADLTPLQQLTARLRSALPAENLQPSARSGGPLGGGSAHSSPRDAGAVTAFVALPVPENGIGSGLVPLLSRSRSSPRFGSAGGGSSGMSALELHSLGASFGAANSAWTDPARQLSFAPAAQGTAPAHPSPSDSAPLISPAPRLSDSRTSSYSSLSMPPPSPSLVPSNGRRGRVVRI